MQGKWEVKAEHLRPLHQACVELREKFEYVDVQHVRRHKNKEADAMANKAIAMRDKHEQKLVVLDT